MTDYIKRDDAVEIIERLATQITPPINIRLADVRCGVLSAKWLVEDMQSADVVEVVRCKDCKYGEVDKEVQIMLKAGDTITCHDKDDLIDTMFELARSGVETDFDYNDVKPRLIVTAVGKGGNHDRPKGK